MAEVSYNSHHEELHPPVMSERVQALANNVYREFETMISLYGDGVIKNLMPEVVAILESLNQAYRERQEHEVEAELLKEENLNLKGQFEKEKQLRKMTEQKYLEVEDMMEEERRQHSHRVEVLDSNIRRLEVKARNAQDQFARQEERKSELKLEYDKLHARYTELFKNHAEYIEKVKLQAAGDRATDDLMSPRRSLGKQLSAQQSCDESITNTPSSPETQKSEVSSTTVIETHSDCVLRDYQSATDEHLQHSWIHDIANTHQEISKYGTTELVPQQNSISPSHGNNSSEQEKDRENDEEQQVNEALNGLSDLEPVQPVTADWPSPDESSFELLTDSSSVGRTNLAAEDFEDVDDHTFVTSRSQNESSVFVELSMQDADALGDVDDGADLSVMSAEVEKIILENNELLETKNALNIVKDDLIARLDELSGEHELLRAELSAVILSRDQSDARIVELEEELRKCRKQLEDMKTKTLSDGDADGQLRFTRVDMTRVIMERNHFKEKLMELQEAVRYAEIMRASREHPELVSSSSTPVPIKKKNAIWTFFSSLVTDEDEVEPPPKTVVPHSSTLPSSSSSSSAKKSTSSSKSAPATKHSYVM